MEKLTGKEKFFRVQQELQAPKDMLNEYGGYNYRSAESVLNGLKTVMANYGMYIILKDEIVMLGEGDNARFYVKVTATIYDTESDFSASNTAYARESLNKKGMDTSQLTGATSSYARKYALNGLFAIDDHKDNDTPERKREEELREKEALEQERKEREKMAKQLCTQEQVNKIISLISQFADPDAKEKGMLSHYKVDTMDKLNVLQADEAIKGMEKQIKEGKNV